jgi:hypothetical protein
LSVPVGATVIAALLTWLHGVAAERRARRRPSVHEAMASHQQFLDALVIPARGQFRVPAPDVSLGEARVDEADGDALGTRRGGR